MQYATMMPGATSTTPSMYEEFRRLHNKAVRSKFFSLITRRYHGLLNLGEMQKRLKVTARTHGGLRLVPIEKIRGSLNRTNDFDAEFRPLQEHTRDRWVNIAIAHSRDESLPPVELIELDDMYFVTDGHHRISVAKMMGQREIEAEVTVWRRAENDLIISMN
jgi:hypothetical protein